MKKMIFNEAFGKRVKEILKEQKLTQYRLEQYTGIFHSSMSAILNGKIEASNSKKLALIVRELGYTMKDFYDSPLFDFDKLNLDD